MSNVIKRNRITIDAADQTVGRLSTKIAMILRGKTKPGFQPHIDAGDFVQVINCSKLRFTGRKLVQKDYYHHSMHPGGIKRIPMKKVFDLSPVKVIEHAVNGMLPKNKLRVNLMKRLTLKA